MIADVLHHCRGRKAMRLYSRASSERIRKAVPLIWLLIGLTLAVFSSSQVFAVEQSDDFNDGSKNADKWGSDQKKGKGQLDEVRGHLEYVTGEASSTDSSDRPWILRQFPTNANWWIEIEATNKTYPSSFGQWSSFGINVRHILGATNKESGNEVEVELAAFPNSITREFYAEMHSNNMYWDTFFSTLDTSAPIRIAFNATTKIFTVSGFTDQGGGSQWYDFGTFGVGPSGGGYYNADWGLNDADRFIAYVFGYSNKMIVYDDQMYGDNFKEDGGVPWGGPVPEPKGSFRFAFPAGNPLLIAIASIMGNYTGVSPTSTPHSYSIDIAQDESGKLSAMGTVQGAQDKNGSDNLSGNIGAIKTVNGEPTVQLKGSFAGTHNGDSTTLSYTAAAPAKLTDVGGGTEGFAGTLSYKGKLGGVPFGGKDLPIQVAAPPGASGNVKKDWTLQLDITSRQDAKGKSYLVASAELVLPNGDTIVFPEKKTKYSTAKGYSLSFKGGTNTRTSLPDKKTSISIKGMTMTLQQDGSWQANAGTITYQFLGQKGSGNLVDFIAP
jgi:hypothetical protein